ncbi:MAG: hypothetical protein ACYTG6_11880, partial [Planctomycetota bacterium]
MRPPRILVLLPLLALVARGAGLRPVTADVSSEARTPAEVYERRGHLADCIVYVAKDLRVRYEADPDRGPAVLMLVVDPTPTLADELKVLGEALAEVWREGPEGLRVGVMGAMAEYSEPSGIRRQAESALAGLAFLPAPGPKNIHEWVRQGARQLGREASRGPKALLLVTEEGEGEHDVEATRDVLLERDISFYAIAPEAAFERCWMRTFTPREHPDAGLTETFHPAPRPRAAGALFYGGDTAFELVPYKWEFDLAQAEFVWVRPPRYPVPSGFGYWSLATLAYSTGGRYFIYDFTSSPTRGRTRGRRDHRTLLYDYSRMNLVAPDLRPRRRILKDLAADWRAETIIRIWGHLADEANPVLQSIGTLERVGGSLAMRPARPVRSTANPEPWYYDMGDVREAIELVRGRLNAVEQALKWWSSANARARTPRGESNPLQERIEADFQ